MCRSRRTGPRGDGMLLLSTTLLISRSAAASPRTRAPPLPIEPALANWKPFAWKCRVVGIAPGGTAGHPLPPKFSVAWEWGRGNAVASSGTGWSDTGQFNISTANGFAGTYPDQYSLREGLQFFATQISISATVCRSPKPTLNSIFPKVSISDFQNLLESKRL